MCVYTHTHTHTHTHIMEYYATRGKDEIVPLETWMDLDGIRLSKISQTEKDKYHMIPLICEI